MAVLLAAFSRVQIINPPAPKFRVLGRADNKLCVSNERSPTVAAVMGMPRVTQLPTPEQYIYIHWGLKDPFGQLAAAAIDCICPANNSSSSGQDTSSPRQTPSISVSANPNDSVTPRSLWLPHGG